MNRYCGYRYLLNRKIWFFFLKHCVVVCRNMLVNIVFLLRFCSMEVTNFVAIQLNVQTNGCKTEYQHVPEIPYYRKLTRHEINANFKNSR